MTSLKVFASYAVKIYKNTPPLVKFQPWVHCLMHQPRIHICSTFWDFNDTAFELVFRLITCIYWYEWTFLKLQTSEKKLLKSKYCLIWKNTIMFDQMSECCIILPDRPPHYSNWQNSTMLGLWEHHSHCLTWYDKTLFDLTKYHISCLTWQSIRLFDLTNSNSLTSQNITICLPWQNCSLTY